MPCCHVGEPEIARMRASTGGLPPRGRGPESLPPPSVARPHPAAGT
jgi:hypothetical protein